MEKLHTSDNKEKLVQVWDKLDTQVLDYTFNILQSHAFIDHTDEINSVYALVPIITYIYLKKDHKLNEEEIAKIIKWFYYSQIRTRYISQLHQKLDKDIKTVGNSSSPFDDLLETIAEERPLEIKPSDFVGRDIRHPLFSLMRWFFKSQRAICLGTGNTIRKNMGEKYQLERDHIFSYAKLRDSDYYDMNTRFDYALAQEMTNRAILTSTENGSKSAKHAHDYLSKVQKEFPSALRLQCIPEDEDLWHIEKYKEFLEARRQLLAESLNRFLDTISIAQSISQSTRGKIEMDILELIQGGERDFIEFKETLRWDTRLLSKNPALERVVMKTIAAFNNKEGGTLIMGVSDDGTVKGLDNDFNTLAKANKDGFELHLRELIKSNFGEAFAAENIKISFPEADEISICRVDIKTGSKPLFLKVTDKNGKKEKKFYVRSGNSSPEMPIDEAFDYISNRF